MIRQDCKDTTTEKRSTCSLTCYANQMIRRAMNVTPFRSRLVLTCLYSTRTRLIAAKTLASSVAYGWDAVTRQTLSPGLTLVFPSVSD